MAFGEIEGVLEGQIFKSRRELYEAGVHRALINGIVGPAKEGAESIVLSGGYVDDEDDGKYIKYTGHGGRDGEANQQISDQSFTRQNQALVKSCLEGLPVRVVRGSQHKTPYSPKYGYRYDGLFRVENYWMDLGKHDFKVCRFYLVKLDAEESVDVAGSRRSDIQPSKGRVQTTIQRIVRDTALGRVVKKLYDYRCQVCGETLLCVGGPYAEAAHVRPLGRPHDGPDEISNLLCLCPNHHVLLDRGAISISDEFVVYPLGTKLRISNKHEIDLRHLAYQRNLWLK